MIWKRPDRFARPPLTAAVMAALIASQPISRDGQRHRQAGRSEPSGKLVFRDDFERDVPDRLGLHRSAPPGGSPGSRPGNNRVLELFRAEQVRAAGPLPFNIALAQERGSGRLRRWT